MSYFKTNTTSKIHTGHLNRSHVLKTDCGKRLYSWDVTDLGAHISDEEYDAGFCKTCEKTFVG